MQLLLLVPFQFDEEIFKKIKQRVINSFPNGANSAHFTEFLCLYNNNNDDDNNFT